MWGMKEFSVKNNTEELVLTDNRNFRIVQLQCRVVVHFSQLAKMHALSFCFGDLKSIYGCPFINFVDTLLQLTLCCPCIFGFRCDAEVIYI